MNVEEKNCPFARWLPGIKSACGLQARESWSFSPDREGPLIQERRQGVRKPCVLHGLTSGPLSTLL
jgi:hypothetical protein